MRNKKMHVEEARVEVIALSESGDFLYARRFERTLKNLTIARTSHTWLTSV